MGRKVNRLIKDENGAALFIEAAVIYPIVFMCIFFLIYIGLYILQSMMLNSYAQKIAVLASREVAYPGYMDLADDGVYKTGAVDADFGDDIVIDADNMFNVTGEEIRINRAQIRLKCTFDTKEVKTQAYRYWSSDPLSKSAKEKLVGMLVGDSGILASQSVLGTGTANVVIECDNNIISQIVTVSIEQDLIDFGVMGYFGIETPKAAVKASATVSDSDELVRNADFVVDVMEALAAKLGINIEDMREKIDGALKKIGLIS